MKLDQATLTRARLALREAVREWIYDPNVMLIDFGWPEHDGKLAPDELAIRIHVKEKKPRGPALEAAIAEGKTRATIPTSLKGFQVDVPQGTYRLQQRSGFGRHSGSQRARRNDPMRGGISLSDGYRNIYGTLGGPVVDRVTGDPMILSNWHVLAGNWSVQPGWPIVQPGIGDGGRSTDKVAEFSRHAMSAGLDAAVARLTGTRRLINDQYDLGRVSGVGWADLGMEVVKSGRKTNVTYGVVTAIEATVKMTYRGGIERLIQNVVTIEPRAPLREVSAGGDSGSLWCDSETMRAVALHFAGTDDPERALAMDIQPILDVLNVDMVV